MQKIWYKIAVFWIKNVDVDGGERPQCLICMKILTADSMKPKKLRGILKQCMMNVVEKHQTPEFSTEK